ncbi:ABC transporter permease [candidate division KSB1 bacterium]
MCSLLKLAYKNVFRNFRRSLLTFIAISLGLGLSIIMICFQLGFEMQAINLTIDTKTSHLKLYGSGYTDEKKTLSLDYTINNYEELLENLKQIRGIKNCAPRILFSGYLNDGIDELMCIGAGIDPESENRIFNREESVIRGEYLVPGEEKMLLGEDLAELFKVNTGDYLTVVTRTKYGTIAALDFEIKGIIDSGNPQVDNQYFFIPLDIAQEILETENQVSEISLKLNNKNNLHNIKNVIFSHPDYKDKFEAETYIEMLKDLIRLFSIRKKAIVIIAGIFLLMAAAGIANTMLMSVFERTKEIGTMMAIGMKPNKIVSLFCLEAAFIGIFGSIIGCGFGSVVTYYYEVNGINLESTGVDKLKELPISSTMYADLIPEIVLFVFVLGIIISVLSALYPAVKASRLVPSEALRKV